MDTSGNLQKPVGSFLGCILSAQGYEAKEARLPAEPDRGIDPDPADPVSSERHHPTRFHTSIIDSHYAKVAGYRLKVAGCRLQAMPTCSPFQHLHFRALSFVELGSHQSCISPHLQDFRRVVGLLGRFGVEVLLPGQAIRRIRS